MKIKTLVRELEAEIQQANNTASNYIGVDDVSDVYWQGVRNGLILARQIATESRPERAEA